MNFLLEIYRRLVPERVRRAYNEQFKQAKIRLKNRRAMRRRHYGDLNKDKTFYVICPKYPQSWGLATAANIVINNIQYAVERGWIPIVDFKRYYLFGIQNKEKQGKENAWEYYFEQPVLGYSLEDVYQSKNVIFSPDGGQPYGSMDWNNMKNLDDDIYTAYFETTAKYIRIRPEILESAEEIRKTLFKRAGDSKILGIGIRAGLYWGEVIHSEEYKSHPKGLSIDEYIELTHRYMRKFDCEYIFVSCDDRYYMERMKQEFGERCLYMADRALPRYFDDEGNPLAKEAGFEEGGQDAKKHSIEYLIEIYLLSVCDSLFRVLGGGSGLACLLNNRRYENCYMVDKGINRG